MWAFVVLMLLLDICSRVRLDMSEGSEESHKRLNCARVGEAEWGSKELWNTSNDTRAMEQNKPSLKTTGMEVSKRRAGWICLSAVRPTTMDVMRRGCNMVCEYTIWVNNRGEPVPWSTSNQWRESQNHARNKIPDPFVRREESLKWSRMLTCCTSRYVKLQVEPSLVPGIAQAKKNSRSGREKRVIAQSKLNAKVSHACLLPMVVTTLHCK